MILRRLPIFSKIKILLHVDFFSLFCSCLSSATYKIHKKLETQNTQILENLGAKFSLRRQPGLLCQWIEKDEISNADKAFMFYFCTTHQKRKKEKNKVTTLLYFENYQIVLIDNCAVLVISIDTPAILFE